MASYVFISDENEIAFNLAFEKYLVEELPKDSNILFLWSNSPVVVIGRYQNPWEECRLEMLKKDGVTLQRRQSGGGAVYQDKGNICFTLITSEKKKNVEQNFQLVLDALKTLGIDAVVNGRNDIEVDGKKVSGSAFRSLKGRFCHHGTMLVNTDLNKLSCYLTPSRHKLKSHSVKSVRSRVINLSFFNGSVTTRKFAKAMSDVFRKRYNSIIIRCNKEIFNIVPSIKASYVFFKSNEWNLGKTPRFSDRIPVFSEYGELTFYLDVINGVIEEVSISSDSLDTEGIEAMMTILNGVGYSASEVRKLTSPNLFVDRSIKILASTLEDNQTSG